MRYNYKTWTSDEGAHIPGRAPCGAARRRIQLSRSLRYTPREKTCPGGVTCYEAALCMATQAVARRAAHHLRLTTRSPPTPSRGADDNIAADIVGVEKAPSESTQPRTPRGHRQHGHIRNRRSLVQIGSARGVTHGRHWPRAHGSGARCLKGTRGTGHRTSPEGGARPAPRWLDVAGGTSVGA